MNDMVSIIVPIYNCESRLKTCLASIMNQTYKNIEIILVNDGSMDHSGALCDEIALNDKRVKVFHQVNSGPSAARNKGLELATGKYIQFVDSDDFMVPNMTESMVKILERDETFLCICGCKKITDNSEADIVPESSVSCNMSELYHACGNIFRDYLINSPWNKLYVREKIDSPFDESISLGEDLLFNLNYFQNVDRVSLISEPFYHYVDNSVGLTKKVRPDSINIAERLYHTSMQFIEKRQLGEEAAKDVGGIFIKSFIYGCYDLCANESKKNKEKKDEINKWLSNHNVQKAVRCCGLGNSQQKIAAKLIKNKATGAIFAFMKLKQLLNLTRSR